MKVYHKVWLDKHKGQISEEWLRAALQNGFDIHHIDGNKHNHDPNNLVLIFGGDHLGLHGKIEYRDRWVGGWKTEEEFKLEFGQKGEEAYKMREKGFLWKQVEKSISKYAMQCAKYYAQENNLSWPIKLSEEAKEFAHSQRKRNISPSKEIKIIKTTNILPVSQWNTD